MSVLKNSLLLLGISLLLAGCSLNRPLKLDPRIEQQIAPRAEITDTPFILQEDFQCGPASLAMVMNLYGANVTPKELARQVFTPKANGSFPVEMDIASRHQGFVSFPVSDRESLIREIDGGHPVLVLQNLSIDWYPMWHFAVVVGYDLKTREFILRSATDPRRHTPMSVFENTWKRSDHWGRVVLPPDRLPVTASPVTYVALINNLEQVGQTDLALQAYQTALAAWPDSHLPGFALANLQMSLQQTDAALASYQQLLARFPHLAVGWNNYAYGLKTVGCNQQAQQAAACGVKINPQDANLADTLTEMQALPANSATQQCPLLDCPANSAANPAATAN